MKEKIIAVLTSVYGSVENALQSVMSKRVYVIALLVWLAISEMSDVKFVGLCIVGIVYIWSEVQRKQVEARKEVEKSFSKPDKQGYAID